MIEACIAEERRKAPRWVANRNFLLGEALYLTLMDVSALQRKCELLGMFERCAGSYTRVRLGLLPNDFPPWGLVDQ